MKSMFSSRRLLITLIFVLAVVLSACERTAQPDGEEATATPASPIATPVQPVVPTVTPVAPVLETPAGGVVEGQPTIDPALGLPTATPIPGTGAGTQPTPAPPVPSGQVTYVVTAGDTLFSIARRYNLTVEQVAAANNIDPNGLLVPGQTLIIPVAGGAPTTDGQVPGGRTHVVVAGDNLFRIGLRYGFTVAELASYNNIANPHLIYVGQIILIPPGGNP